MFFNQGIFEQQRIVFRFYNGELDVVGIADEHLGFCELVFFFAKVGNEAVAQVFSLTDIENNTRSIYEFIDAGFGGNSG